MTPRWIERVDIAGAEHVARLLAAQVDLVVLDVLGPARHRPAIEADDLPAELVVEPARDDATEPAADAGDHDLARPRVDRSVGGSPEDMFALAQAEVDHRLDPVLDGA